MTRRDFRISALAALAGLTLAMTACIGRAAPCTESGRDAAARPATDQLYVTDRDPYDAGALAVRTIEVAGCTRGAPRALEIHAPLTGAGYPVVVFQHGFLSENRAYRTILTQLASHGFVVVAPQMIPPGPAGLFNLPTAEQEAEDALAILDWLPGEIDALTGLETRWDRVGLAGHSRGGKVAWLMLARRPGAALAVAGIDPVDGRGGPAGDQPRVLDRPVEFTGLTLVLGVGEGGDCAPAGENHVRFFAAARAPAYHVVVPGQGHGDMLDEDTATGRLVSSVCFVGAQRAAMQRLTAGLMVQVFSAALQSQPAALDGLRRAGDAPLPVEIEVR